MTAFPEKTHSGNLNRTKVSGSPEAGARTMVGKTNECDSVIKDAKKYTPSTVTTISNDVNKGAAIKAAAKQNDGNVLPVTNANEDAIRNKRKEAGA